MSWLQLTLETDASDAEHISDLLSELGAVSVTYEDGANQAILEPAPGETVLWQHTRLIGLYEDDTDMASVVKTLRQQLDKAPSHISIDPLEDRDWSRAWMDKFQPMPFGQRLWIVPSWHTPTDPNAINVILDPGLAFGTGTHPTTSLCLQWLDQHPPKNLNVIDYGCGSGILAIAAALLGARHVWAVDHDPQALQATRDNAEKNNVSDKISTCLPAELPEQQSDLLLANILANPLIELSPLFAQLTKGGAQIVLSGILTQQADEVTARYQRWFRLNPAQQQDDWVALNAHRNN